MKVPCSCLYRQLGCLNAFLDIKDASAPSLLLPSPPAASPVSVTLSAVHSCRHQGRNSFTFSNLFFNFDQIFVFNPNFGLVLVGFISDFISFSLVFMSWTHFYLVLVIIVSVLVILV